ncbi:TRAP transporter small permease subunit [Marinobacter sp. X15-166B]|uniref:TRAP transporter small permease subunit n=1 Tax=Marinobacter sp. X15-166B TaxID=1897620 RepID=UPI00085C0B3E|nr:TRAP transporter small permease [Marinobacter sp. X15-166B]OEY66051.1 C4-dicarboxylate ABC transporter substrate-binding protein [Marinobacter sp. X15-166B]
MNGIRYLTHVLGVLAGTAVALMMVHIMADVLGKYLFNQPVPSTAEVVANYYMIATVFLSLAYVEARGTAISVDLVYDHVGPVAQRLMRKIGQIVTLVFYVGFGWLSWEMAQRAYRVSETVDGLWRITIWPAKFLLPLGLAVACLVLIFKIFGRDPNSNGHEQSHEL